MRAEDDLTYQEYKEDVEDAILLDCLVQFHLEIF